MFATVNELKEWVDDSNDFQTDADGNSREPLYTRLLTAAADAVMLDCGRQFFKSTAEARTYYPDPAGFIWVHDLISVTSILYDGNGDDTPETALTSAQYRLLPKTGGYGQAATRYTQIYPGVNSGHLFIPGRPVLITGDWGYVETIDGQVVAPRDIQLASLMLASRYLMRRKAKLGRMVIPEAGLSETLPRTDPDYQAIVERYKHPLMLQSFA